MARPPAARNGGGPMTTPERLSVVSGASRDLSSAGRPQPSLKKELAPFDPLSIARAWPERWMRYLHAHFRSPADAAVHFSVSEVAARKWWEGVGACRGDKVATAVELHPETAPAMLFAAE